MDAPRAMVEKVGGQIGTSANKPVVRASKLLEKFCIPKKEG